MFSSRSISCFASLLFICVSGTAATVDPCTSYTNFNDSTRIATYTGNDPNGEVCDRSLKPGWYRNMYNGKESEMAIKCPVIGQCGASFPIWLNGTLPTKKDQVSRVSACKIGFGNCCHKTFDINVKNCGNYKVYELTALSSCPGKYCFAAKCPPGHILAASGSCIIGTPTDFSVTSVTVSPYIPSYDINSTQRALTFKCQPSNIRSQYRQYSFDIIWYIDGHEIVRKTNLTFSSLTPGGDLLRKDWNATGKRLGIIVQCGIRAHGGKGTIPTKFYKSRDFFAGVKVLNPAVTVTGRSAISIRVQSTVPVACAIVRGRHIPCTIRLEMFDYKEQNAQHINDKICNKSVVDKTHFNPGVSCGIMMNGWHWSNIYTIQITSLVDQTYRGQYEAVLKLRSLGLEGVDDLWTDYALQDIKVTVNNIVGRTGKYCTSYTDPNIYTFDWKHYSVLETGEFLLYKHKDKPISVNTIHRSTSLWNYENCAVAIQAGSDMFIIYGCEQRYKWVVRRICNGHTTQMEVYENNGGKEYEIHLPTGTRVVCKITPYHDSNINIEIYPSASEWGMTSGLCGTFNGRFSDDFTDRNGKVVTQEAFIRDWSVPRSESLFVAQSRHEILLQKYYFCSCQKDIIQSSHNLIARADCSYKESLPLCPLQQWDKKDCRIRVKRDTHDNDEDDDIDIDAPPDIVEYKQPKQKPTWRNGWNETSAREFCTRKQRDSSSFESCKNVVESSQSDSSVDICVSDIKASGGTHYADDSVESFKANCLKEIQLNSSLWVTSGTNSKSFAEQILDKHCPGDCLQRGLCVNGKCQCSKRFSGPDCSIDKEAQPEIFISPKDNVCDQSKRPCGKIAIFGRNFLQNNELQCRFSLTKSFGDNNNGTFTTRMVKANLKTFSEVECQLPGRRRKRSTISGIGYQQYLLSVTNNANNFSNPVPIVIYDSTCTDCQLVNQKFICQQRTGMCVVDNKCSPLSSSTCKSRAGNNEDSDNTKWILVGVCCGVALLLVAVFIGYRIYCNPRKQVDACRSDNFESVANSKYVVSSQPPMATDHHYR